MADALLYLPLEEVVVSDSHRDVNEDVVKRLASSIKEIGLRHPITVRSVKGEFRLIAGRHRLEATRRLKETHIATTVVKFDATDAEMWEISENLHRAELTALERAECIERWRALKSSKVGQLAPPRGAQIAHPAVAQPHEHGVSKTADELGIDRRDVQRAERIASLTPEAKEVAREHGLDDNASVLLEASREEPGRQAEKIAKIVAERAETRSLPSLADRQYQNLMREWNDACDEARDRFMSAITAPEEAVA